MSEGIPKSARDALARQTPAEPHLSPDLLNAYAEQALSEAEKLQVTTHLASCAECRDVVFLATAATQDLQPAMVAAASPRTVLQPAVAAPPRDMPHGCAVLEPRHDRPKPPRLRWKWALPLMAVAVLGAVALIERDRLAEMASPPRKEMASARQQPSEAQPNSSEAPPAGQPATPAYSNPSDQLALQAKVAPKAVKKDTPTQQARLDKDKEEAELRDRRAQADLASNLQNAPSNTMAKAAAANERMPSPAPPPATASRSAEATAAAPPPVQADNADLSASATQQALKPQALAKSLASNHAGALSSVQMPSRTASLNTKWRISEDGHVEHTVGPNTWTRVMAAEPVTFRVVATVGNNVWAGGSEGSLYHSSDGGLHWNRVALVGEMGAITTIHFNNAQQGSLTSDNGATWTTSDGGQTWSKQ
jgi:hypothetical protein